LTFSSVSPRLGGQVSQHATDVRVDEGHHAAEYVPTDAKYAQTVAQIAREGFKEAQDNNRSLQAILDAYKSYTSSNVCPGAHLQCQRLNSCTDL